MNIFPLLSLLIVLPLAVAVAAVLSPRAARALCLTVAAVELEILLAVPLLFAGPHGLGLAENLAENLAWIPPLGVRYALGLDGLSYVLCLLTAFLTLLGMVASPRRDDADNGAAFYGLLLASSAMAMGVFLARDLLLFYLFWEAQLVPMFFLIARYGHENRRPAAIKFFVFSLVAGLPMLLAVVWTMLRGSGLSLEALAAAPPSGVAQALLLGAFLLAFAVKTPVVPLHTWLPDAHTQAPTAGSLLLAGVLLKTGAYAMLRWGLPLFPDAAAQAAPVLCGLGVLGLFYASWIALAQEDLKRLVAYSSIAHMGLVVLGIAAFQRAALAGAAVQMVAHALSTGALFIMVGMLSERAGTRRLDAFGGLWQRMPVFGAFFMFFAMASAGLPGLSNFTGEAMILVGSFQTRPVAAALGFGGIVAGLAYILRMLQFTVLGSPGKYQPRGEAADLNRRELLLLALLALAVLFVGLHPGPMLHMLRPALDSLAAQWPG